MSGSVLYKSGLSSREVVGVSTLLTSGVTDVSIKSILSRSLRVVSVAAAVNILLKFVSELAVDAISTSVMSAADSAAAAGVTTWSICMSSCGEG